MVDTVGTQLRRARAARDLTLDDAARETKIRAARLADLEADVYTNFPNLAYARGFLTSYGKYLAVDVRPYLEAFENTSTFGVDDYQYLSENPVGVYRAPRRVWRQRAPRKRLVALGGTLGVLLVSMFGWFLYINYLRLGDLNKLAEHQDLRGHQGAGLSPAAMLARPIPSEAPAASLISAPAAPAAPAKEPEPARSAMPTEIAMMEKLAAAQPLTVPDQPVVAPAVQPAPLPPAPAPAAAVAALPDVDPAHEHQLIDNHVVLRAAPVAPAGHRLSAHAQDRTGRVSFDTTPPQPPTTIKSFE